MYFAKPTLNHLNLRKEVMLPYRSKVVISTREGHFFIEKSEIDYIEADGNYCQVHYGGSKKLLFSKTMKHLITQLTSGNFIKIHQSYLININKIKHIDAAINNVTLNSGKILPIARSKKEPLKAIMKTYFD